ncbi:unnamed protein product [Linum tenue]|uniref:Uncharacterized protein n=1 Tax=Linum tenue TaxID=586396 RepID=A0AAV0Q2B0_9ROSI|nr:unnamed protein product [Linum tenue]
MDLEDQMSTFHLLKAYGEAMEMDQRDLAGELLSRLEEKSSPTGTTLQRLVYYLVRALDRKHPDMLRMEASRNYELAFKAFYQIFPYGKFAHFTANSVILDALPYDHHQQQQRDFDIGCGVQWPPLMEGLAARGVTEMRLTIIRWNDDEAISYSPTSQRYKEIQTLLQEQARIAGLNLIVEETDMDDLEFKLKKVVKRNAEHGGQCLVFNCMAGLPHMGRGRNAGHVMEFLRVAKESIESINSCHDSSCRQGVITFGDGIGWGKGMSGEAYGPIFEGQLGQFYALLESMEGHMPYKLREARVAMECLFLTPYVACIAGFERWEGIIRESKALAELRLQARGMRRGCVEEARELVREGESLYWVSVEGVEGNQLVLGYKETPLLKVSCWR